MPAGASRAPVINEDKALLARRRFVLAAIGGADPFAPRAIVIAQLALALVPAALAAAGALLPLVLPAWRAAVAVGASMACFLLAFYVIVPCLAPETERVRDAPRAPPKRSSPTTRAHSAARARGQQHSTLTRARRRRAGVSRRAGARAQPWRGGRRPPRCTRERR